MPSPVPTVPDGEKARRVYLSLRDDLSRGLLPAGAMLPGEQRLAQRHGVSRVTVRRALQALADDGLIERQPGRGTVVCDPGQDALMRGDLATLMPQVIEMGRTEARLLSFGYGPAPAPIAAALGLATGTRVQSAVRVRLHRGGAFSHLTTHVPEPIAISYSEADLAATPLYQLLERGGLRIESARQTVSATLATPEVAEALGTGVGAPLLHLERVVCDSDGRPVEHLTALYRPELFRLEMALCRVGGKGNRHWAPLIGPAGDEAA